MIIKESEKRINIYFIKYFSDYFNKYFNSINVEISDEFQSAIEANIEELIRKNISITLSKLVKFNFDRTTLQAIDIHYLCGYEAVSKITSGTFNFIFKKISEEEPEKTILDLLKTESNFYLLIKCCYYDFIKKTVNKKFRSLNNFNIEKKDLIIENIVQNICENYNYYKLFDPQIASFKTYLYKDTLNSSISVFRKESLIKTYYVINYNSVNDVVQKFHNGNYTNLDHVNDLKFNTKNEAENWLSNYIDMGHNENNTMTKGAIIIKKEGLHNSFDDIQNYLETAPAVSKTDIKHVILLESEMKRLLKKFNLIEKDDTYRMILKLYLGININLINTEIRTIFGETFNLDLLAKLYPLCLSEKKEKSLFFQSIKEVLGTHISSFRSIFPASIQQRIYRLYDKIRSEYSFEDLTNIIMISHDESKYNLFEEKPVFLKISNPSTLNSVVEKNNHHELRVIDLSYAKINEIPSILYEMSNLREINLSFNYLSAVPELFLELAHLKVVDLRSQLNFNGNKDSDNNFEEIRKNINRFPNCKFIFE